MSALQEWLRNHNRKLSQEAIDEALMAYITHIEQQRDELQEMSECAAIQIQNLESRNNRLIAKLAKYEGAEK